VSICSCSCKDEKYFCSKLGEINTKSNKGHKLKCEALSWMYLKQWTMSLAWLTFVHVVVSINGYKLPQVFKSSDIFSLKWNRNLEKSWELCWEQEFSQTILFTAMKTSNLIEYFLFCFTSRGLYKGQQSFVLTAFDTRFLWNETASWILELHISIAVYDTLSLWPMGQLRLSWQTV
jgi:hypothetical protein